MKNNSGLSYEDWSRLFAAKCSLCKSSRFIVVDNVKIACPCQVKARKKFRLEQVELTPSKLKYCEWKDFTGMIEENDKIEGTLTLDSLKKARDAAFRYCFDVDYSLKVLENSRQFLCVHRHLSNGRNMVISGSPKSGKTLLACLILKEVANLLDVKGLDVDYKWVNFYDIIDAARWHASRGSFEAKQVNFTYLDHLASLNFLFIDGVEDIKGGHNVPPDLIALNNLFGARKKNNLPTIIICSINFKNLLHNQSGITRINYFVGHEFLRIFSNPENVCIELQRAH